MLPSEYGRAAESLEKDHGGTKKNVPVNGDQSRDE